MSATTQTRGDRLSPQKLVRVLGVLLLAVAAVAAAWSIYYRMPYGLGGRGSPDDVAVDFITKGTALAPPVITMIVLALTLLAVGRRGVLGTVCEVVVGLLGAVYVVGILGEPSFPAGFTAGQVDLVSDAVRVLALILAVGLVVATVRALLARRRRSPG